MANTLKLFLEIQKKHFKTAFISKSDAFINTLLMIINNMSFAFMWWVLFQNRQSVNGWTFDEMLILFSITCNAFAIYALFFRGIDNIYRYIDSGSLDNFLVSPRSPLFMLSTSHSTFVNWGDFMCGFLAFYLSSYASLPNLFLIIIFSIYGFLLLFGFQLSIASVAFKTPNLERLGHNFLIAFLIFWHQPASIFVGWLKVIFFTAIPAGFMTLLPVEMLREFSWLTFLYMNIGCLGFFFLGIWLFNRGLKNYSSGNRFGVR
ncbi:MAG: ABC-2 family transporter protein [Lactobacillus sp.]|nr:ABC-2 family transporter protein [Lactobacillus sp.]